MEFRIVLLCVAAVCSQKTERFYTTQLLSDVDQAGEQTDPNPGFVEPVDFAAITQQFLGASHGSLVAPFSFDSAEIFGASETKDVFTQQAPFQGDIFGEESRQNSSGFVEPVDFSGLFDKQGAFSENIYNPKKPSRPTQGSDGVRPTTEDVEEYSPRQTNKVRNGKSSYPAPQAAYQDQNLYPSLKEVEVFYPKGKAILPTINGRPKPYDGYRAAAEGDLQHDEGFRASTPDAVGRYTEGRGQVTYARNSAPSRGVIQPFVIRRKRSNNGPNPNHNRTPQPVAAPAAGQAAPNTRRNERKRKTKDNQSRASQQQRSDEYSEDPDVQREAEAFHSTFEQSQHENNFDIPELRVKTYPFERMMDRDRKRHTKREEQDYDDRDEYTSAYLDFKASLPSSLEEFFGSSGFDEKYTVSATENLGAKKDCVRIEKAPKSKDGKAKRDADTQQVCYSCSDPNTGGSYEQCAYETLPQEKKYFVGGASSYSSKQETDEDPARNRRSLGSIDPFSYEVYFYDEPTGKRVIRQETERKKSSSPPKKVKAKKYKKSKRKIQKSGSSRAENVEGPPRSYEGPAYTYEGPAEPYEGPSQEYYDKYDEKFGDYKYVPPKTLKYQYEGKSSSPKKRSYYTGSPVNYEAQYREHFTGPKRSGDEFPVEDFLSGSQYSSYKFGPEFFEDFESSSTNNYKPATVIELAAPSNDQAQREPFTGNVKIYKNGEICEKKKKDNMICMECKNEKSGGTYEQCQYSSKPKDNYYKFGTEKSFKSGGDGDNGRPQRSTSKDLSPEKSDVVEKKIFITKTEVFGDDPDELAVAESRHYNSMQEFMNTGDLVGSFSENTETIEKLDDEDDTEKTKEKTDKEITNEKPEKEKKKREDKEEEEEQAEEARDEIPGLDEYLFGSAYSEKDPDETSTGYKSYDDYFRHLFPEIAKVETDYSFNPFTDLLKFQAENLEYEGEPEDRIETQGTVLQPLRLKDQKSSVSSDFYYNDNDSHKKNLEYAYSQFQKKDWSNCKKIEKDKMVCYQCVDKNGLNNEECMFVEESQPTTKTMAYHEKKDIARIPSKAEATTTAEVKAKNETETSKDESSTITNEEADMEKPEETKKHEQFLKGDFEGVERVAITKQVITTEQTSSDTTQPTSSTTLTTTSTTRSKLQKVRTPLRTRGKTAETTTEVTEEPVTEKPKKRRKYPVKKFNREEEKAKESKADQKKEKNTDASDVKIFLNNTNSS